MKKFTVMAVAAGAVLGVALLVACNGNGAPAEDTETVEVGLPCYTVDGQFVKWDDDCGDDKDAKGRRLVVGPPPPAKTSGGLKTSGPLKPAPKPTRR